MNEAAAKNTIKLPQQQQQPNRKPLAGIRLLDSSWIDRMEGLEIISGDGQVVHRGKRQLVEHFQAGHSVFGAVAGDRLVGQTMMTTGDMPAGSLHSLFNDAARNLRVAQIGGVVVAADYRGKGLMGRFLDASAALALETGCDAMIGLARITNTPSISNFLARKFVLIDAGISPLSGRPSYTFGKHLHKTFADCVAEIPPVDPLDIHTVRRFLDRGYIGTTLVGPREAPRLVMSRMDN